MAEEETEELIGMLKVIVKTLVERGVSRRKICEYVNEDSNITQLSRLKITKNYRLLLTDYDIEIKLEPIHKAVYILFLRHKEGIRFKELVSYRDELYSIYKTMKHSTQAPLKVKRSIADLTNPLNSSIIEKCSRINSIIKRLISNDKAHHYMIVGEKGEIRRIELNRELIDWEEI